MLVLIIDPNTKRQQQLRSVLASLGHRSSDVESCRDPEAGAVMLRKKRYDVCFFAFDPPVAKYFETLKDAGRGTFARPTAIVAMSATTTREFVRTAVMSGAATFLASPFSVEAVEGVLRRAASWQDKPSTK